MEINRQQLIEQIEQGTGLRFQAETESGNLCFRENNQEMRNDFKEIFTISDLELYIRFFGENEIQLPTDNLDFWKKVDISSILPISF